MNLSPSSRRAWIEILLARLLTEKKPVALLAEGVDRNFYFGRAVPHDVYVALLAEGVDRNSQGVSSFLGGQGVALLAEGVDGNPPVTY